MHLQTVSTQVSLGSWHKLTWSKNVFCYLLPKQQILDYSKLKEFADDNFEFVENGRKFSKWVENTVGKGGIARYE